MIFPKFLITFVNTALIINTLILSLLPNQNYPTMKRFCTISILAFTLSISVHAQVLWQITGADLKKPSYLFVTHDLIPIQFLDSIPELFRSYNRCDIVVSEVVLNHVDDLTEFQQAAIMPNNTTIADLLNLEDFTTVSNELKSVTGTELNSSSRLHPSLLLALYRTELFKNAAKFVEGTQSDSYFQLIASQQDKRVIGLETAGQQIFHLLLENKTLERDAKLLVSAVMNKDSVLSKMLDEVRFYKTGNIDALSEALKQKEQARYSSVETYEQQLKQRNIHQFNQILELINTSPCFITVNAIHLQGRFGLINQLREKKYSIKEVKAGR